MSKSPMSKRLLLALALATLAAVPADAAPVTYTIDATHSNVGFRVRHLVSKVNGSFKSFDGTIVMDAENPAASSVTFTIKAASISTDNEQRDTHLKGDDFFAAEKFPELTFKSTAVKKLAGTDYEVKGNLTMRGVTKEITLPVSFLGEVKDPWGNTKAGFSSSTTVNRKDYGINWNKALDNGGLLVSDDVEVSIELEVARK
jgi:polyisoprenoid-binding protein YceI